MSKARDLADSAQEINILDGKSFLDEDNLASDSATGIASQQSIKAYVDGITTTNITSTGALNSGSITSGFGNIDNGSSTITTTGAISGGSFVIGSADINENDLESIDGITAGTVSASKAVVVNTNKDITGFRNITATGTISGSLSGTLSGSLSSTTTATTQAESDDSTKVATTEYVSNKITTLIGGAPSTLNDLNELAAAINDDANYNTTLTTALATKLPLAGGTMTGDVLYNDNVKAKFGAGSDLQIYHYGGNSFITESGSGSLFVNASNLVLRNTSGEYYFYGNSDGSVNLYHDNAAKLATTSTGIDVTGTATADNALFSGYIDFQTGGVNKGNIYTDASTMIINTQGTNTALNTNGGNVGIGTTSPSTKLAVSDSSGGNVASFTNTTSADLAINLSSGVSLITPSTGTLAFGTSNTERMRIDSSGNVGIGTDSPKTSLDVSHPTTNQVAVFRSGDSSATIGFADNSTPLTANLSKVTMGAIGSSMVFNTNSAEQMRIDSSGNLLVGTTSGDVGLWYNRKGVVAKENGQLHAAVYGGAAAVLNRNTNDGDIVQFRKAGTTVGSISSNWANSTDFTLSSNTPRLILKDNGGAAIAFDGTYFHPWADNAIDLGYSANRWKDVRAVRYYGDGSNLTGVGGSTAYGAVGTYVFAKYNTWTLAHNVTVSGSTITAMGAIVSNNSNVRIWNITSGSLSGTWRSLGGSNDSRDTNNHKAVALFVRVS